jgi:hypothetical protein
MKQFKIRAYIRYKWKHPNIFVQPNSPFRRNIYIYIHVHRVSQEECAKLRESVPYIKVYWCNPKHLYPKLNGYGDNNQRKVWSSCGSTYCTCSADTLPVHCACPSLKVSLLSTLRLLYEWLVTCTEYAVQSEREVVHMYTRTHVSCKVLGTLRTTAVLMRMFM